MSKMEQAHYRHKFITKQQTSKANPIIPIILIIPFPHILTNVLITPR